MTINQLQEYLKTIDKRLYDYEIVDGKKQLLLFAGILNDTQQIILKPIQY